MSRVKLVLTIDNAPVMEFDLNPTEVVNALEALNHFVDVTIYLGQAKAVGWLIRMLMEIRRVWAKTDGANHSLL